MFKRYIYIEGLAALHGGNGKFLINNDGQIKDIKGNDIEVRYDKDGNKVVTCDAWDGTREYRVIDLVAIQFKSLFIPRKDYGKVIAFTIDGNPENTHAKNIGYRFEGGKLEVDGFPGFYYVPSATSRAVDKEGNVLATDGKPRLMSVGRTPGCPKRNIRGGYQRFSFLFYRGVNKSFMLHRALCLVFKEYPDNVDSLDVNHINGIPGDDRLENLEWVTRSQNSYHAYKNDLKNQHLRVLVRDVRTKEVKEFYSISEAARYLKHAKDDSIRTRIYKSPFGTVFQDGTQIKLKSDKRDWIEPEDVEKAIWDAQEKRPVRVRNCATLEVKIYESCSPASKETGIDSSTLHYRLKKDDRSPLFGYQVQHASDPRPFPSFTQEDYQRSLIPSSFKVEMRNLLTGEERTYTSANKAKETCTSSFIKTCLNEDGDFVDENGWCIRKRNGEWPSFSGDIEEVIYKQKRDIMAKHEETGKVILADSAKQMSEVLGLDPKAIRVAAFTRGNKLYHGYRFRLGISREPWPTTSV